MHTADLCDAHENVRVLAPIFRDFGRRRAFHGRVRTLRLLEDNAVVRTQLTMPGNGDDVAIAPGDWLYADEDGIVVASHALHIEGQA